MLDKTKLPLFSTTAIEKYFMRIDNVSFDNAFLLMQFYISRLLCSNRIRIQSEMLEFDTFPNLYCLSLQPSGSNKDKHRKLVEKMIPFFFKDLEEREVRFREMEKARLSDEADEDNLTKTKKSIYINHGMPRSLYSVIKSNASPEGLGALHDVLYRAKFGAVVWLDKEISDTMAKFRSGSPLDDLVTQVKEAYDNGEFEPKLIKGEKMIKAQGEIPYLAWLHGAIDQEDGQKLFKSFFTLGYGRRLIIGLEEKLHKDLRSIDQITADLQSANKEKAFVSKGLKEIYERTAVRIQYQHDDERIYTLTSDAERFYAEYKQQCENDSIDLPKLTSPIIRDEMKNRHWKALKLSCVYAVQESGKMQITKGILESAIYTIEYFSKNLSTFLNMRGEASLAEQMINSLQIKGDMKKTDFYNEQYFPKYKTGQKKIFEENMEIAMEIAKEDNKMIINASENKRSEMFRLVDIPEHKEAPTDFDIEFSINKTNSEKDTNFEKHSCKWSEFHKIVSCGVFGWAPTVMEGTRCNDSVSGGSDLCVFDVDNKGKTPSTSLTINACKEILKDFTYMIATTKSNQKKKGEDPAMDRFRVIIPLTKKTPFEINRYKEVTQKVANHFGFLNVKDWTDSASFEIARFYYSNKGEYFYNEGKIMNWEVYDFEEEPEIPNIEGKGFPKERHIILKNGEALSYEQAKAMTATKGGRSTPCQCINKELHKNGDRNHSAYFRVYKGKWNFFCSSCKNVYY